MVEEEDDSSNVSCGSAVMLQCHRGCDFSGCGYNRRNMGQRCARLFRRRTAAIRSKRPLLVVFNSLLAMIKIVANEILLRL
ncbi:hypothetical protein BHE74_00020773 [Ensete ventricosum]|nr:hypothetical protein BHE74_00020773 [Ensete ventricosum]